MFTLDDVLKRLDPALVWTFDVDLPDLYSSGNPDTKAKRAALLQDFGLRHGRPPVTKVGQGSPQGPVVEAVNMPHASTGTVQRFYQGAQQSFPDISTLNEITMDLYEDRTFSTTSYLLAWKFLVSDRSRGNYRESAIYRMPINVKIYDGFLPDPVATGKILGAWPTTLADYAFQSATGRLIVNVQFAMMDSRFIWNNPARQAQPLSNSVFTG